MAHVCNVDHDHETLGSIKEKTNDLLPIYWCLTLISYFWTNDLLMNDRI